MKANRADRSNRAEKQRRYLEDKLIRQIDQDSFIEERDDLVFRNAGEYPFGDEIYEGQVHSLRSAMEDVLAEENPYYSVDEAIEEMMLPGEKFETMAEVYEFPAPSRKERKSSKRKLPAGERQPQSKKRSKGRKQERDDKHRRAA